MDKAFTEAVNALARLRERLRDIGHVAVAVSGGVDSMTLAVVAGRVLAADARMFHARSAAVPLEATARVESYALSENWALEVVDAGEFSDPDYLSNPLDRCFHCKQNLYAAIAARSDAVIVSGTNHDDLSEFRPGLAAARDHGVRHPYVEEGIDKRLVRALAAHLGLDDLVALPAAPCLASRIETGLPVRARELAIVHRIEREISTALSPKTVRCRRRHDGVVIELDAEALASLSRSEAAGILEKSDELWRTAGIDARSRFEPYQKGSAFVTRVA